MPRLPPTRSALRWTQTHRSSQSERRRVAEQDKGCCGFPFTAQVFSASRCSSHPSFCSRFNKGASNRREAIPYWPPTKEAERRTAHLGYPHLKEMRARPYASRSPFGAPPRLCAEIFRSQLGPGRASWNRRMQTGGPSPTPVQQAPCSPITRRTGRCPDRLRTKVTGSRPQEPLPLHQSVSPADVPHDERDVAQVINPRAMSMPGNENICRGPGIPCHRPPTGPREVARPDDRLRRTIR